MNRTACITVALGAALAACKGGGGSSSGAPGASTTKGPPPVTIANAMGYCEDTDACTTACNDGDAESCRKLAVTFEFGKTDAGRNETLGTTYFDRACALGSATGCVSSGQMHEYGHGVPKEFKTAADAYARACTLGYQVGCANYAIMLENGRGVDQDLGKAKTLYEGACKAGAGLACERMKALQAAAPAASGSGAPR
jgi:TPR repeat protein